MKSRIKKAYDGKFFVAYCENIPAVFVQCRRPDQITNKLREALRIVAHFCRCRWQSFPPPFPQQLKNITLPRRSIPQQVLVEILEKRHFHIEYQYRYGILFRNVQFPFEFIHLPVEEEISPLILEKLFTLKEEPMTAPMIKTRFHGTPR